MFLGVNLTSSKVNVSASGWSPSSPIFSLSLNILFHPEICHIKVKANKSLEVHESLTGKFYWTIISNNKQRIIKYKKKKKTQHKWRICKNKKSKQTKHFACQLLFYIICHIKNHCQWTFKPHEATKVLFYQKNKNTMGSDTNYFNAYIV